MSGTSRTPTDLTALFLGPKAENADVFERLLLEAFRDHVFWRRNFHPEDGFTLTEKDRRAPSHQEAVSVISQELMGLLGQLKDGVPFHSPRYIGHMASDTSMAATIGYFAALLYNPNNVATEAAPVTTRLELAVGQQLATMIGYPAASQWSHLTSGGTVANFEALWIARSVKYLPVALRWAAASLGVRLTVELPDGSHRPLEGLELWQLLNLGPAQTLDAADRLVAAAPTPRAAHAALAQWSLAGLGAQEFGRRLAAEFGDALPPGVVLVPSTAHYSWEKICRALGIGASQLIRVPVDGSFRMDLTALEDRLEQLHRLHQPVIACVTVAGTTEEAAVDRVDQIVRLRERVGAQRGMAFHLHADAAWGGYAAAVTRTPEGGRRPLEELHAESAPEAWPSPEVYAALCGLEHTDSITLDPHKLGYVPYPAGAICFRDARTRHLVSADAPYVFLDDPAASTDLGRFVFEGSKPGAAAAAVWMAHRVLALDQTGYGHLVAETARGARRLYRLLEAHDFGPFRRVLLPPSDLNIVCFALGHPSLKTLADNNAFTERLHRRMSAGGAQPARTLDYFVSRTTLLGSEYGAVVHPWSGALGFGPAETDRTGGLTVLRCTVMDPLVARPRGQVDFLAGFVDSLHRMLRDDPRFH